MRRAAPSLRSRRRWKALVRSLAPATTLARVQGVWESRGGPGDRNARRARQPSATAF